MYALLPDLGGPPLGQASFGSRAAADRLHEYRTARGGTHIVRRISESNVHLHCVRRTQCSCMMPFCFGAMCRAGSEPAFPSARCAQPKPAGGEEIPHEHRMSQENVAAAAKLSVSRMLPRAYHINRRLQRCFKGMYR